MRKVQVVLAEVFAVLLLAMPERAMTSAAGAMAVWYASVAPAMFPFLAVLPLLTCREARRAYDAALGWLARPLFRLPGEMTSAALISMVAGSPTGTMAAVRAAAGAGLSGRDLKRCALAFSGLGPVFLVSGVGTAMFGDREVGIALLAAQTIAQLTTAAALRFFFSNDLETVPPMPDAEEEKPVRAAALATLQVCGYMALFSVIGGMLSAILGETAGNAALCTLDFPSGAALVAVSGLPLRWRVTAAGGMLGFGGFCVACQNMLCLRRAGVRWREYLSVRAFSGAVCAGAAWLLCPRSVSPAFRYAGDLARRSYGFGVGAALFAALPGMVLLVIHQVLTNKRTGKRTPKMPEIARCSAKTGLQSNTCGVESCIKKVLDKARGKCYNLYCCRESGGVAALENDTETRKRKKNSQILRE